MTVCKDCNCETLLDPGPDLLKAGWDWIDLVDGDDVCNGWRCPACVKGSDHIVESAAETRH